MFDKILIANRGEIACRIIRSAREMGIGTVAVYSDADATSLHADMADEAVRVGPPPSAESYLVIDRIVQACRDTGAQAVHPGYGFLAENTRFAEALHEAGIAFIGPPAEAIAAMGDKITSKRLADRAGVNTIPGHPDAIADADEAVRVAGDVGYPVMVKASAGGGGKGMRIARDDRQVREGFRGAQNEARSSFGDDRVFIEKFIEEPRHIEIQVLADGEGNIVHLGERECSIQRRHQKVIEESPSPFIDAETRAEMGAQAVALAEAVGYRSAGTVEFIVDRDKRFYFLEMNTRLQVEHPVTELVTGLDLVELMIRVAAGEALPLAQQQVRMDGWALEARVYAEDPLRGFLPSIGRLSYYREPPAGPRVRVDSGVLEGSEISMFYDPMIAKLCTHGATREEAIGEMQAALDAFYIRGINHNTSFLTAVIGSERFREGRLTTNFIDEEYADGFKGVAPEGPVRETLIAVAAVLQRLADERATSIEGQMPGHERRAGEDWVVLIDEARIPVTVARADGGLRVDGEGVEAVVDLDWRPGEPLLHGHVDGRSVTVQVDRKGAGWHLVHGGAAADILVLRPRAAELAARMPKKHPPDLSKFLLSPMPGLLVSLTVKEGTPVKAGEELAVVEAMKMENVLRAEHDGRVAKLHAEPGASLAADQAILEFE